MVSSSLPYFTIQILYSSYVRFHPTFMLSPIPSWAFRSEDMSSLLNVVLSRCVGLELL